MNSLSVSAIPKIVALLLIVCLARAAAGSCLSYGHSCWGGHGKRSASLRHLFNPSSPEKRSDEWYFSKLVKLLKERPIDSPAVYRTHVQDSTLFDKFNRIGHQKFPFSEIEDSGTRNPDTVDLDDMGEREAPENIDMDSEVLLAPEEEDEELVWKSKLPPYHKMGGVVRKETAG